MTDLPEQQRSTAAKMMRRIFTAPEPPTDLPPGRMVELPGRGATYVVDVPGPAGAPTLVLLHALGCTGLLSWYPSIVALSANYRVVTLDQRWHGRGIKSAKFRLTDCADDVAALADALDIDSFIPVGYSMGGLVAQLLWLRHGERVDGLVLGATARNFRGARRERFFFPVMAGAMVPLGPVARRRVDRYAAALPSVPSSPREAKDWGLTEFRSTSAWSMPAVLAELGRFNSASWIAGVDVPTAVVATIKDHTIPVRRQLRMAECIPGATVHEVPGGHAALVLKAEQFVPVLVEACATVAAKVTAKAATPTPARAEA